MAVQSYDNIQFQLETFNINLIVWSCVANLLKEAYFSQNEHAVHTKRTMVQSSITSRKQD